MPAPITKFNDVIRVIGAKRAFDQYDIVDIRMTDEQIRDYIIKDLTHGIATEIAGHPQFFLKQEDDYVFGTTKFSTELGVIFDMKRFKEKLSEALNEQYTNGYKRALEEVALAGVEEQAAKDLADVEAILSEANEVRVVDE